MTMTRLLHSINIFWLMEGAINARGVNRCSIFSRKIGVLIQDMHD